MNFGDNLRKIRKDYKMSQEDLAEKVNVSRQSVSKWETNNSYPETDKIRLRTNGQNSTRADKSLAILSVLTFIPFPPNTPSS